MKRTTYIWLLLLLLCVQPMSARKTVADTLRIEEQMRRDYFLYAAIEAHQNGDHARAYFMLEMCHTIDPTNAAACSLMGTYVKSLFNEAVALPYFETAYKGSPEDYWSNYVETLYELGQKRAVYKVLQQVLARDANNEDVLAVQEQLYRMDGQYRKALKVRDKIDRITGEPTTYSVISRYEILRQAGQKDKAIQVIDNYLQANPNDGRMQAYRRDIALSEMKRTNNVSAGRALLRQQLESPDLQLRSKLQLISDNERWLHLENDTIEMLLHDLQEQYPFEEDTYKTLTMWYRMHGTPAQVREMCEIVLRMNPADSWQREQMLKVLQEDTLTTAEEFVQYVNESYTYLPDDAQWSILKVYNLMRVDDKDSALIVIDNALAHVEESAPRARLLKMKADICGMKNDYAQALDLYEQVLQMTPDDALLLNDYAYTMAVAGGDLKYAERMSQRALQADGTNASYLDTYAWILHLQGEDVLALFYMKKALENVREGNDATLKEHYNAILQSLSEQ